MASSDAKLNDLSTRVEATVRRWLHEASELPTPRSATMLADVLSDPRGLDFTVGFVDRVVRPEDSSAAAEHLRTLAQDPPSFISGPLSPLLKVGAAASHVVPGPVVGAAQQTMRAMVSHLILDARDKQLGRKIAELRKSGRRLNINLLGEAVLGSREAQRRVEGVRELIARPDVDYCSIKVSAVVDHINLWGARATADQIVERLEPLYRLAASPSTPTFINLDMEEFHDLELTVDVFERLLSTEGLTHLHAGIVLQAYLPDAERMMKRLRDFARARVEAGGAPIKVRLVKGANLPMERVDAALHGWPLATWGSKLESDAHYKRVLSDSLTPENLRYVHIGVAGHNLFDAAHAFELMKERGIAPASASDPQPLVEFEMLAGMASAEADIITKDVGPIRLYVPIVKPSEFDVAVSYLVRRLEENASSENFMSAIAGIGSEESLFERECSRFEKALRLAHEKKAPATHRVMDRSAESPETLTLGTPALPATPGHFVNTPDTDTSVRSNQRWVEEIRARIATSTLGTDLADAAKLETVEDVQRAIAGAVHAHREWAATSVKKRAAILRMAAVVLASHRAELIEVAASETGKTIDQADPEVSEAIDFALYYAQSLEDLSSRDDVRFTPRTLTLVTPPWNFPVAIPCGSILSALATGSAVVVKPAPQARRTGAYLVSLLHEAGIPADVLRLVDVPENEVGKALIADPRVDQIILTGAYDTAKLFASFNPGVAIKAETSGKNAIIVTEHADLDLAAKDVVNSAFGHAGQKCSAASLVITVGSVTRSARFNSQLADAVLSLHVGYPTEPLANVGPVIEEPGEKLRRGLTELADGEKWLSEPHGLDKSGRLFFPGARTGVKEGSEFHTTEYFGPILGIMHADTLEDAIRIQNGTAYGLTAGLHSLEPREIETWLEGVEAGNLYINRGITGAIVERQAFGGWKRSAIGKTAKAGGPNYLVHLMDAADPAELESADAASWLTAAKGSDEREWSTFFAPRDRQQLHGEVNVLRYCPTRTVIRVSDAPVHHVERILHAARVAAADVSLSLAAPSPELEALARTYRVPVDVQAATDFAQSIETIDVDRIRTVGAVEAELREAIAKRPEVALFDGTVVASGRVEILPFVREQAVSATNHRYGNPLPYDLEALAKGEQGASAAGVGRLGRRE